MTFGPVYAKPWPVSGLFVDVGCVLFQGVNSEAQSRRKRLSVNSVNRLSVVEVSFLMRDGFEKSLRRPCVHIEL